VKTFVSVLVVVLALAAVATCQTPAQETALPSVDQVLDKNIAAEGGKDAIQKITSRASKGTIDVLTFGASGTFEQLIKSPDKTITTSEFPGFGTVIQCYDGKAGWATDPQSGMRDMNPGELSGAKRTADLQGGLRTKEQYKKLAVTGKGKVGDRDAYVLEGQRAEGGGTEKLYFDAETGLLSRLDIPIDQGGTATLTLEDYKAVDGVKIPFVIHQDLPELSLLIKLQEVKQNVPIDDAKFTKPVAQPAPEAPKPPAPEPPK
jgi:outer membrane lipoprotein-sorting protein